MPNEFKIKNGVIVDQGGANISGSSFISGALAINASGSNVFTVDGTAGRLFSVDDSLSGSLFSVNTAAGLPVIEAFSDNIIRVGQYGKQALFISQSKVGIGKENALNGILDVSGSVTVTGSITATNFTGSLFGSASYALTASFALNAGGASIDTGSFATTGSNIFRGNQIVTGSLFTSGSNTLVGVTTLTGSLLITGSTTQTGNNTLIGNTLLSGSIIISGSQGPGNLTASVQIYGDIRQTGYHRFDPVNTSIDTSISASYIYVSGSTNDLYFSQNGQGYANTTRLRWLEGNLYTGLLGGGVLSSTPGSTTFNLSSGSGIIVSLNAVTSSANPFPTIQYVSWPTYTNQPIINSGSAKITYISVTSAGAINQQIVPIGSTDVNQYDTQIEIGVVLHLSGSVSSGVYNTPQLSYGYAQRNDDFVRAFGPLKVSGHTLQASGSTLGLIKSEGTAYNNGSNYVVNPNHASLTSDPAITTSKIYRYYVSGSTSIIDTGVANAGYTVINPTLYNNNGVLTAVPGGGGPGSKYTIQRVFWIPNSPTNAFLVYYGNAAYSSVIDAQNAIGTEPFTEAPNTTANGILIGYIIVQGKETNLTNATIIQGGLFRSINGIGNSNTNPASNTLAGLADVSISSPTNGQPLVYNSATSKWENQSTLTATLVGNASTATTASFAFTSSLPLRGLITGSVAGATLTFTKGDGTTFDLTVAQSGTVSTASYVTSSGVYGPNGSNSILSSSFAATAALAPNYVLNSSTGSFVTNSQTSSFVTNSQTGSFILNSQTSSMTVATASFATSSLSSSFASTASFAPLYVLNSQTSSFVQNSQTSSFVTNAQTSSFVLNSQTSSMTVASASQAATASSADNFTVRGTLTAQTIVAQTITSSTDFVTGSTRFGSLSTNTHQFTGSVSVTGSLDVNGTARVQTSLEIVSGSGLLLGGLTALGYVGSILEIGKASGWSDVRMFTGGVSKYLQTAALTTINNTTINLGTATVQLAGVDALTYSGTDLRFGSVAAGFNNLSFHVAGSEKARITAAGRLLLGTTSEDTILLDVSGSARLGSIKTGNFGSGDSIQFLNQDYSFTTVSNILRINVGSGLNNKIDITNQGGNTAFRYFTGGVYSTFGMYQTDLFSNNQASSAILELRSNAMGFLLPRMTAAQRIAISSPAQGLLVYDTGSVTEGLWLYNLGSTPGWQEVLTNTGSQSILGGLTATSFTGSLQGTSSWAQNAVTSSYILQAVSASFASTASYWSGSILNATSASFATTASYASNGGVTQIIAGTNITISPTSGTGSITINAAAGAAFPFTGSAIITGSLVITGSTTSTLGFTGSLFGTSSFTLNIDGGTY